jgi:hypothetical protein
VIHARRYVQASVPLAALVRVVEDEIGKEGAGQEGGNGRHPNEYVHPVTPILLGMALGDREQTEEALRAYTDDAFTSRRRTATRVGLNGEALLADARD